MMTNPFKREIARRVPAAGLGMALAMLLTVSPARAATLVDRVGEVLEASSGITGGAYTDSLFAVIDTLEAEAVASVDTLSLLTLRTHRGRMLTRVSRFGEAEVVLHEALATAEATGDSAAVLEPLYRLVHAIDGQGRPPRVVPWMQRLLALSVSTGDEAYESRARVLVARRAMREGRLDEAVADLERAHEVFRQGGELRSDLPSTQLLLGLVAANRGDWDTARTWWQACADSSRAIRLDSMEAGALTNLGLLELSIGDPAAALRSTEAAYQKQLELGQLRGAVHPAVGTMLQLAQIGRYDEALERADEVLAITRSESMIDLESMVLRVRGNIHGERGTQAAGLRDVRAALRLSLQNGEPAELVESAKAVARHLAALDSNAAALAYIDTIAVPELPAVRVSQQAGTHRLRAQILLDLDRPGDALEAIETGRALADPVGLLSESVPLAVLDVEARLARGELDTARERADEAVALWERRRLVTTDATWREVMGEWSPRLSEVLVDLELASGDDGVRAWERLQRLRTRTLLERMAGPTAADSTIERSSLSRPADFEDLRPRLVDRSWIEVLWGRRTVTVWILSSDGPRVLRHGAPEELAERVDALRRLARNAPPGADHEAIVAAGARLGRELFGDAVDRPAWLVGDGPLLRLPPSLLRPGVSTSVVPSAAVLLSGGEREVEAEARAVVLSGEVGSDGVRLGGVVAEVGWLADRLGARRASARPHDGELGAVDVLHVAAHAEADDRTPWRSGILLGAAGTEEWWRAESIAATPSDLRLVVLSACSSADGRAVAGEGILGLTQAFLAAGARCVVATAWPVDDGVALAFTRAFYAQLQAGATVGDAVEAARATVRGLPAAAHPRHWAPWVAIGDATMRVPVHIRTAGPDPLAVGGLVLLVLGLAGAIFFRRTRDRV